MNEPHATDRNKLVARRWFLRDCGVGLGGMALASLLSRDSSAAAENKPLAPRVPHFAGKAKRVIYLFQSGAPSQMELFDYKPRLEEFHGQDLPESVRMGQRLTGMSASQSSFPAVS